MNFHSLYDQGFARVAAVTLPVHPARPFENAREIIDTARELDARGVAVGVYPELCVSGYAIDDLLLQDVLLDTVEKALGSIVEASADLLPLLIVGAPLRKDNALYNCAVAIHRGRVLAIIPKSHLPNYREFYEKRYFVTMPPRACERIEVPWGGIEEFTGGPVWVPFGQVLISADDVPGLTVGIEICEDMWVPVTPATELALAGATVLANLSASPITVGRGADRELMVRSISSRCCAAYVYTAAGMGESSTDLAWDGETMIYEAGDRLAIGERFQEGAHITIADVDLEGLRTERKRQNSFTDNAQRYFAGDERMAPQEVEFTLDPPRTDLGLERAVNRFPFVPNDPTRLEQDCYEAYNIQVAGLVQRLRAIGNPKIVIGVSGGLDSTHALVVAARAMDLLGRPRTDILCYTLPGFATSERTKTNATRLCEYLGTSFQEIDIRPAATQMLADIGHPYGEGKATYDVTFENVQAGLRTDYLFRLANHLGGIVLGTGDLSELALGWCTYGVGDQMSHYAVKHGRAEDPHAAPDPLGRILQAVRRSRRRGPPVDPAHGNLPRAGSRQAGREDAVHAGQDRPLQPAGLHALLRAAPRRAPLEDRVPGGKGVVGRLGRLLAGRLPRGGQGRILARGDRQVGAPVPVAFLQPAVQAQRPAQRPEGHGRRLPVPARGLAHALGRVGRGLGRGARRGREGFGRLT